MSNKVKYSMPADDEDEIEDGMEMVDLEDEYEDDQEEMDEYD